jgi:SAM-dependent methyltransferase
MIRSKKLVDILEKWELNSGTPDDPIDGTDKDTSHSYTGAYDEILTPYESREITFLEVGVNYGGSYLLWKDLLPKAKFALVDISDRRTKKILENTDKKTTNFFLMDAYTSQSVETLKKNYPEGFDVIIEDGPHTPETQAYFVKNYLQLLKKGGVMVIEDLAADSWIENLMSIVPQDLKENVKVYDLRSVKGRWDDILFVIRK